MASPVVKTFLTLLQEQNLYYSDTILTQILSLDNGNFNPDEFTLNYLSCINFNKENIIQSIIRLYRIANDFDDNRLKEISSSSISYLCSMIQIPSMFNENYTLSSLESDFLAFLNSKDFDDKWFDQFSSSLTSQDNYCEESIAVFGNIIVKVANSISFCTLDSPELGQKLNLLSILLKNPSLRKAFAQHPSFEKCLTSIFSHNVFFKTNYSSFSKFFKIKDDDTSEITPQNQRFLENSLKNYHSGLFKIAQSLLGGATSDVFYSFLKKKIEVISEFFSILVGKQRHDSTKKLNFGDPSFYDPISLLINLSNVLQTIYINYFPDFTQIDPLAPYWNDSIIPIGESGELALKGGRQSWVDDYNSSINNFVDIQEQKQGPSIEKLKIEWENIIKTSKSPKPNTNSWHNSLLFFATSKITNLLISNVFVLEDFKFTTINSVISIDSFLNNLFQLICRILNFLLYQAGYNSNTNTLPNYPPQKYARLPEDLFKLVVSGLRALVYYNYLQQIPDKSFIINSLVTLFSNQWFIRNPLLKSDVVLIFSIFSRVNQLKPLVISGSHLVDKMMPSVINFFNMVQFTGSENQFTESQNTRKYCINILNFWLQYPDFRDHFSNMISERSQNIIFISYHLSYFYSMVKMLFDVMEFLISKNLSTSNQLESVIQSLNDSLNLLNTLTKFGFKYFEGYPTEQITDPNAASIDLGDSLSSKVMYSIKLASEFSTKHPNVNIYDKKEFLMKNCQLLHNLKSETIAVKCAKQTNYSPELMQECASIIAGMSNNQSFDTEIRAFFDKIKEVAQRVQEENEIDNSILDDLPEQALCEIESTLLTDPIKYPSGHIVNRAAFQLSYMNEPVDPFSSVSITPDMMIECPEAKAGAKWCYDKAKELRSQGKVFHLEMDGSDEWFKDSVTGELLDEPVKLPSGKYVSLKNIELQNEQIENRTVDENMKMVIAWYKNAKK